MPFSPDALFSLHQAARGAWLGRRHTDGVSVTDHGAPPGRPQRDARRARGEHRRAAQAERGVEARAHRQGVAHRRAQVRRELHRECSLSPTPENVSDGGSAAECAPSEVLFLTFRVSDRIFWPDRFTRRLDPGSGTAESPHTTWTPSWSTRSSTGSSSRPCCAAA